MDQTTNRGIMLANGIVYDGVCAIGDGRVLGLKKIGNRTLLVEVDQSGKVVHEAVIPDRWQAAMEFFFEREEEPLEGEDDEDDDS